MLGVDVVIEKGRGGGRCLQEIRTEAPYAESVPHHGDHDPSGQERLLVVVLSGISGV